MKEIQNFISGFKHFRNEYFCRENSPFAELQSSQNPSTMVIACSDSRTDPSLIMKCGPGEIFVVRNIANIVPPCEDDEGYHGVSAAIEYAVLMLQVRNIIVLGHSSCGGIRSLMQGAVSDSDGFVGKWLSAMTPVREKVLENFGEVTDKSCTACEMAGILHSLDNLMTFPWIAERVADGRLDLHGWYFDMESGTLLSYLPQTCSFEPLTQPCPRETGQTGSEERATT